LIILLLLAVVVVLLTADILAAVAVREALELPLVLV
jgi:hypothetical protein